MYAEAHVTRARVGVETVFVELPKFDMHRVSQALRVNHRLYDGARPLNEDEIEQGLAEYRVFLQHHKAIGAPEQFEVPSYLVDRVWHAHMCETKQYRADCISYFGKIVEHRSEICNGGGEWE
jgi:hypothetical protein